MGEHGVEQLIVRERRVAKPQFCVRRPFLTDGFAHRQARIGDHLLQLRARRRGMQVLDDFRLDAGIANHG
ncbi:hypothetical protein D3C87_1615130 [compost metagenome]